MYVCGPTVYGDAHLGHARPAITFDILFRYLQHLGYKVRYVRNITDVGHLEHDADEGEDKIAKKARLEQLEPMEIAQYYTRRFNSAMEKLNVLGYKTRGGKPFVISTVQSVWNNEMFYKGYYRYGKDGEWVKGQHEAIVKE